MMLKVNFRKNDILNLYLRRKTRISNLFANHYSPS